MGNKIPNNENTLSDKCVIDLKTGCVTVSGRNSHGNSSIKTRRVEYGSNNNKKTEVIVEIENDYDTKNRRYSSDQIAHENPFDFKPNAKEGAVIKNEHDMKKMHDKPSENDDSLEETNSQIFNQENADCSTNLIIADQNRILSKFKRTFHMLTSIRNLKNTKATKVEKYNKPREQHHTSIENKAGNQTIQINGVDSCLYQATDGDCISCQSDIQGSFQSQKESFHVLTVHAYDDSEKTSSNSEINDGIATLGDETSCQQDDRYRAITQQSQYPKACLQNDSVLNLTSKDSQDPTLQGTEDPGANELSFDSTVCKLENQDFPKAEGETKIRAVVSDGTILCNNFPDLNVGIDALTKNGILPSKISRNQPGHREISFENDDGYHSLMSIRAEIMEKQHQTSQTSDGSDFESLNYMLKCGLEVLHFDILSYIGERSVNIANVFPGLNGYFEKLQTGVDMTMQEQMAYEWLRLITFAPYDGNGIPVLLARAGFYHVQRNETRCFSCNISYSNWNSSDNIQQIHSALSPNCPLMTGGFTSGGNIPIDECVDESRTGDLNCEDIYDHRTSAHSGLSQRMAGAYMRVDDLGATEYEEGPVPQVPVPVRSRDSRISSTEECPADLHEQRHTSEELSQSGQRRENYGTPTNEISQHNDPPQHPIHPYHRAESTRLATFATWPTNLRTDIQEMARAGLFYTGEADFVICFHCGVGIRDWSSEDDPFIEHARFHRHCVYINRLRGREFVEEVIERRRQSSPDGIHGCSQTTNQIPMCYLTRRRRTIDSTEYTTMSYSNYIRHRRQALAPAITSDCCNRNLISLKSGLSQTNMLPGNTTCVSSSTNEANNTTTGNSTVQMIGISSQSKTKTLDESKNAQRVKSHNAISPSDCRSLHETPDESFEEQTFRQPENTHLRNENSVHQRPYCRICMAKKVDLMFLPCSHAVFCKECGSGKQICPICKAKVLDRQTC